MNWDNWICTDPDELQFGKKTDKGWEYIQALPHTKLYEECKGNGCSVKSRPFIEHEWYREEIILSDYTNEEIKQETDSYEFHKEDYSPEEWEQLCCECLFEKYFNDF